MHKLVAAAALSAPLFLTFGVTQAAADPQMLGVIQTASAVPLHCSNGECGAELTSICLQEERATPTSGYRYSLHDTKTIGLTGIRRDGSRVALLVEDALKFAASRGYLAVKVSVSEDFLRQYDVASLELSVGAGTTLVPERKYNDDARGLTESDIELGVGIQRQTATAIVDSDADKGHASQLLARMIDALPRAGKASVEDRVGVWDTAAAPVAEHLSNRGVHRARAAYNSCYRQTRIGDKTLRECLGVTHDSFMQDLNDAYWNAVNTSS
jgi:hypothetical protein